MHRRNFIIGGILAAGGIAARPLWGQVPTRRRAAVVIGVNRIVGMPLLKAAQSGARQFAQWLLQEEKFDSVHLLIDDKGPVTLDEVFSAVKQSLNFDQLVIYFAGHGFTRGYAEFWLLSGAPENPNQAISVRESVQLAFESRIPQVSFISDACRSTAQSLQAEQVSGGLIFPNPRLIPPQSAQVDQFFATMIGDPSWELPVDKSSANFAAIYTEAFLSAFTSPDQSMIFRGPDGREMVPNRQLKNFLDREVPRLAHAKSILLEQRPQTLVISDDDVFIGHVIGQARRGVSTVDPNDGRDLALPGVGDIARMRLRESGLPMAYADPSQAPDLHPHELLVGTDEKMGYSRFSRRISNANRLALQPSYPTGLVVVGTQVREVVHSEDIAVNSSFGAPGATHVAVPLDDRRPSALLGLEFADGSGAPVAVLQNYITAVAVGANGVDSVSYIPSRQNALRPAYDSDSSGILEMLAAAATAARFGTFALERPKWGEMAAVAKMLTDRIRVEKRIDLTLGLYVAYAFAQAGLINEIQSLEEEIHYQFKLQFCDIALLAGRKPPETWRRDKWIPPFPMLSPGWNLLRVNGLQLPEEIAAAKYTVRTSLWTTFGPAGMPAVKEYLIRNSRS